MFSSVVSMFACSSIFLAYAMLFVESSSAISIAALVVGSKPSCLLASSIIFSSALIGVFPKYPSTILPYPSAILFHFPNMTLLNACWK